MVKRGDKQEKGLPFWDSPFLSHAGIGLLPFALFQILFDRFGYVGQIAA